MTVLRTRARFAALLVSALVPFVVGWWLAASELTIDNLGTPALLTGVGALVVVPGLVAEWRRPNNPLSLLVVAVGVSTVVADYRLLEPEWAATVGAAVFFASPLIVCHFLLASPDGLPGRRRRRVVVIACWVLPVGLAGGQLLLSGPPHTTPGLDGGSLRAASWAFIRPGVPNDLWFRQGNLVHAFSSDMALRTLWGLWSLLAVSVGWGTVAVMAKRLGAVGRRDRPMTRSYLAAAITVAAGLTIAPLAAFPERVRVVAGRPVGSVTLGRSYGDLVTIAPTIGAIVIGSILVWGELIRPRLGRAKDGVIQLDPIEAPVDLDDELRRVLGDASARVLYPRDEGRWVDAGGRAARLADGPDRAATIVTREGAAVAAVDHDAWLLDQSDLIDIAVTSAALTIEGRRLAALARATTDDIQASAVRLLESAEYARRSVEAQIEAGPGRTLASVSSLIDTTPSSLPAIHAGLLEAVAQVREIARGIAPAGLVEDGLAVTLDDLVASSDHPFVIGALPVVALPAAIETTVFVVARDAAHAASGSVELNVTLTDHPTTDVVIRIDGWNGPLDQLVDDRVRTLRGKIDTDVASMTITIPFES